MHREVVKLEYRVSELEQQRAELLEALKEAKNTLETIDDRLMGLEYAEARYFARQGARSSKAAITKAEAAE